MPDRDDWKKDIPTSYNHQLIQQALGYTDQSIGQARQASLDALGTLEGSMYEVLGRQQLTTERDIAQRRMQALRSGMTSSQLAALELQNIQVGQLGAQQMAQQYDEARMELQREFAGAEAGARADMMQLINENAMGAAAIEAQRLEHDIGAKLKTALGEDLYQGLSASDRQILSMTYMGLFDPEDSRFQAVLNKLNITEQELGPEFMKTSDFIEHVKQDPRYENVNFGDIAHHINESPEVISGGRYGAGKTDSSQNEWIREVQHAIQSGNIREGDLININYGATTNIENDIYMYSEGRLVQVKLPGIATSNVNTLQQHAEGMGARYHAKRSKWGGGSNSGIGSN